MSKNDGGPIFPINEVSAPFFDGENLYVAGGMKPQDNRGISLRDYFAAHAPEMPDWFVEIHPTRDTFVMQFQWRWHYADAMIVERERTTNATD
jgi:hypothetical protein